MRSPLFLPSFGSSKKGVFSTLGPPKKYPYLLSLVPLFCNFSSFTGFYPFFVKKCKIRANLSISRFLRPSKKAPSGGYFFPKKWKKIGAPRWIKLENEMKKWPRRKQIEK